MASTIEAAPTEFTMEQMPCGQQAANAVFFGIGVVAYNRHLSRILCLNG